MNIENKYNQKLNMIRVNKEKCTGCGICESICPESCIRIIDLKSRINYQYCTTCTQCIAICPYLAISWDNNEPIPFNKKNLPNSQHIDELLKERRTTRKFKKEKLPRTLVEEIVQYAIYAPTHNFQLRAIIVDDAQTLNQIDQTVFLYNNKIYRYLYKPRFIYSLIKLLAPFYIDEYLKAKPKLESSMSIGRAYESMPPVIIFIVGDSRVPLSQESAQYAIYNVNLYAMTKGLGCRILVGNQMFLNKDKTIRKKLKLSRHEKIFATIGMGFPDVEFKNKVTGKKIPIQWNDQK